MHFLHLLALTSSAVASSGYLKLDAFKTSFEKDKARLLKRADSVQVNASHGLSQYQAFVEIGSDHQRMALVVDTSSSDVWVIGSDNEECAAGTSGEYEESGDTPWDFTASHELTATEHLSDASPTYSTAAKAAVASGMARMNCSRYGTFDWNSSDTFHEVAGNSSSTASGGILGEDTVRIGGVDVRNVTLRVADNSTSSRASLGLGRAITGNNFLASLRSSGATHSSSYSLFLNDSRASVLFGAVDHDKYTGDLGLIPLTPDDGLHMALNRLTISAGHENDTILAQGTSLATIDAATVESRFPGEIIEAISEMLNLTFGAEQANNGLTGFTECDRMADVNLTFNFQGVKITVPLLTFTAPIVSTSGESTGMCELLVGFSGNNVVLGQTFLRSVYLAVDLDHNVAALAPLNTNSTNEEIEVISTAIPSATSAADWSSTYRSGATLSILSNATAVVTANSTQTTLSTSTASSTQSSSTSSGGGSTPFSLDTLGLGALLAISALGMIV